MNPDGIPPEMMAALAGGMAPQPAAGGGGVPGSPEEAAAAGIPPELIAAASQRAEGMLGPEEEQGPQGSLYGAAGGEGMDALKGALDALQAFVQGEDDEENIQTVLKCIQALQGILVAEQKDADGLLQGKASPRTMRKSLRSA